MKSGRSNRLQRIREVDRQMEGRIRVFTGIEVDILADGALDLSDEVLAQMEVVIASVHTRFEQSREEMTARVLARHRESLRAHSWPSHRPAAAAPRAVCARYGSGVAAAPRSWAWPWSTTPRLSGWT